MDSHLSVAIVTLRCINGSILFRRKLTLTASTLMVFKLPTENVSGKQVSESEVTMIEHYVSRCFPRLIAHDSAVSTLHRLVRLDCLICSTVWYL